MHVHSRSPYGSEHAHKLLSVSELLPPTPNARNDEGLRHVSWKKQQQMANILGPQAIVMDTSELQTEGDSCFSACAQLLCNRAVAALRLQMRRRQHGTNIKKSGHEVAINVGHVSVEK